MAPRSAAARLTDALLLAAVHARPDRAAVRADMAAVADWAPVIQAALDHGVAALLCRMLLAEPELLPAPMQAACADFIAQRRREDVRVCAELFDLIDALAGAGVRAVPFKGPTLARQAYADPALRRCRDLDLLIAEADIAPAMAVFRDRGFVSQVHRLRARHLAAYYRYNGQDILFAPDRLPVEPHWAFAPRTLAAPIDVAGVMARAGTVALDGCQIAALSPEDALLVTCFHGSKEAWSRLVWIADVAGLLHHHPAVNCSEVIEHADAAGVRRMVLLGITLATIFLGAPCPAPMQAAMAADPMCRRLADEIWRNLFRAGHESSVFALSRLRWRARERLSDRLRYVAATLTTPRTQHFQAIDLPDALAFLYPAVRIGHDYVALPLWHATAGLRGGRAQRRN